MLRGRPSASDNDYPSFEEAYTLADKPLGIQFYRAKQSFFLPYALLAAMEWTATRLKLSFAMEEVMVEGHGLYELYVHLTAHQVSRICEQGQRYEQAGIEGVYVRRLQRIPHAESGGGDDRGIKGPTTGEE